MFNIGCTFSQIPDGIISCSSPARAAYDVWNAQVVPGNEIKEGEIGLLIINMIEAYINAKEQQANILQCPSI